MKDLFQTFLSALVFGLLVYFGYILYEGNKDRMGWGETNQKLSDEADKFSEKVDKNVRKVGKIYNKVKNELEDEGEEGSPQIPDGHSGAGNATPPPSPVKTNPPVTSTPTPTKTTPTPASTVPSSPPKTTVNSTPRTVVNPADATTPYDVQLALVKNAAYSPKTYQSLSDLGTIVTESAPDGRKKVILGTYYGRVRSEQILAIVKQRGFKDAFLISGGKTAPVTPPVNFNTRRLTPNSYMVQLAAMHSPQAKKIKDLNKMGNVYFEYAADRDITKILIGPYQTEAEAEQTVKTVKQKDYPKAFTRRLTTKDISNLEQIY